MLAVVLNPPKSRRRSRISERDLQKFAGVGLNPKGGRMAVRTRRRKSRRNAPTRRSRRRVRRNAWKGAPRKHASAAKKGWRTRRRRAKVAAAPKPRRRKRRKTGRKGWKGSRRAHKMAAVIGWAGRKRGGGKGKIKYMRRRGVTKRKLRSYRRRHKPAARRRTPVTMWGQVAANPRRKRRKSRKARRSSVRRNRRRSYRRARGSYLSVRRNPSMAATLKGSVTSMFKTDVLRSVAEIAVGGVAAGLASSYLNSRLDSMLGIKDKIRGWVPSYADKIVYVYDKAFALATAGLLGYGAGRVAGMLGASQSVQKKIQSSIAIGGASFVAIQVVSDVVNRISGSLGLTVMASAPEITQSDYATSGQLDSLIDRQIKRELGEYISPNEISGARSLGDYASIDQIMSAPVLSGNDFEDDTGAMATMGENIEERF